MPFENILSELEDWTPRDLIALQLLRDIIESGVKPVRDPYTKGAVPKTLAEHAYDLTDEFLAERKRRSETQGD